MPKIQIVTQNCSHKTWKIANFSAKCLFFEFHAKLQIFKYLNFADKIPDFFFYFAPMLDALQIPDFLMSNIYSLCWWFDSHLFFVLSSLEMSLEFPKSFSHIMRFNDYAAEVLSSVDTAQCLLGQMSPMMMIRIKGRTVPTLDDT